MIRGTGLYELWKTGRYKSYPPTQLIDLVAKILALVPPWTRVYRVQRDIPMPLVSSGVEHGNLRGTWNGSNILFIFIFYGFSYSFLLQLY